MKKFVTAAMSCAVAFAACAGMSVSAEKADTYSAWLVGTIGGTQIWEKADAEVASITGNGSYTVNWKEGKHLRCTGKDQHCRVHFRFLHRFRSGSGC